MTVLNKQKQLLASTDDTATSIAGSAIDARGIVDPQFVLVNADNAGGTLDCKIQGRHSSSDSWYDIPGLTFTQQAAGADLNEAIPTAANAPGVNLPRYIRALVTLAAGVTSLDVKVLCNYRRPAIGAQVDHGAVTG